MQFGINSTQEESVPRLSKIEANKRVKNLKQPEAKQLLGSLNAALIEKVQHEKVKNVGKSIVEL